MSARPESPSGDDLDPEMPSASLREVWPYVRAHRAGLVVALVLSLLGAAATIAQPQVVLRIVDSFEDGTPRRLFVTLVALLVSAALLACAQQLILERSSERLVFSVREHLIAHVLRLPMSVLDRRSRGDLVSRVTSDTSAMREVLSQGIVELCVSAVTVLAAFVMMALIDPLLLVLVVVVVLVLVVSVAILAARTRPAAHALQTRVGQLATHTDRALGGVRTIRAAVRTDHEVGIGVRAAERALEAGLRVAGLKAVVGAFTGIAVQVVLLAVVGTGALRVASGALSVGELGAFVMYMMMIITPVAVFAGTATSLGEALGAFARVKEILDLPTEDHASENADVPVPSRGSHGPHEPGATAPVAALTLSATSFRYDDPRGGAAAGPTAGVDESESGWVLRDIDLSIPADRVTAVVGPSGAGKSTLFALFERFYDVTAGTLSVFGQDVRSLSRDEVRARIAYVEQDAPALSGSVRDNLLVLASDASDQTCIETLRSVNLAVTDADARELLDAEVGEGGVLLSGGERQRLAIARALLSEAPILLLDEATSNLDANNEHQLLALLDRLKGTRTIVVIAHRLSTVVGADKIIVLDGGRVVAEGTHRTLLDDSPLYRDLASRQLLDQVVA